MATALVLGGAASVWADVEAALELGEFAAVVACNDAAASWPGHLDVAVTLHAEKWPFWAKTRERKGLSKAARVFGHENFTRSILRRPELVTDYTDHRFTGQVNSGSSGLFALKVALVDLGFDRAVLCGIPMTGDGAHFFSPRTWGGAASHRRGWVQAFPAIGDRARSMSGWTASELGRPDAAWISGL